MTEVKKIVAVEDEEDILELILYNLEKNGYDARGFISGEDGLRAIRKDPPDLVLLDLMLPGLDGIEVCKKIRENSSTRNLPIIMLTARGEEEDIVKGLQSGADDYVTKPFSPKVLMARIQAVLRRRPSDAMDANEIVRVHDLVIDPRRHEVLLNGESIELTSTEFSLLHYLAQRPGWVFTRDQIVVAIHGYDYPVTDRSIDVQVVGLRKKLGEAGDYIETVRGVGYRFKE